MLGSSLFPPPPAPPAPDQVLKGYRWPASRLTRADMEKLCDLRDQTGRPLTKLLQEAVSAYYRLLAGAQGYEDGEAQAQCCASPQLAWRGPIHNAVVHCLGCGFVLADDGQLLDWHDPEQIALEQELAQGHVLDSQG
jgi:hypothetical protein